MKLSTPQMRKRYKQHFLAWRKVHRASSSPWERADYPAFPEDLRGMACSAKTRAGTPCKITDLYLSGRCKFHGGKSTGPKTTVGKARSALNGTCLKRSYIPENQTP